MAKIGLQTIRKKGANLGEKSGRQSVKSITADFAKCGAEIPQKIGADLAKKLAENRITWGSHASGGIQHLAKVGLQTIRKIGASLGEKSGRQSLKSITADLAKCGAEIPQGNRGGLCEKVGPKTLETADPPEALSPVRIFICARKSKSMCTS